MNELKFNVVQSIGEITANFDEFKNQVSQELEKYKSKEFTEDTKKDAKKDLAELRKKKAAVNERRIEVKKEYMKPYDEFEAKVKELITLIDEPIILIDYKVKEFEEKRINERKEEILLAYEEIVPEELKDYIPLERIYGKKWTNAGTKMKDIREELTGKVAITNADITAIKAMRSEKEETALNFYMENNNLASAIKYLSDYEIQKAEILKRKEAEEAARRERELEAERERIRLEERRRILEEEEIKRKAEKETVEKLKEVDEEQARFLSSEESKKVIYTVVATEEELKDIEQAMTSFGVYFERKDV